MDVPLSPADQVSQPRLRSSFAASFSAPIQAKLAIGKVDDPLEHEADRVADQVLRMSDAQPAINTAPLRMSRQCMTCEAEDKPGALHAKPTCAGKLPVMAPRAVHEALHGPSRPLDRSARAFFEPRFRHDFSLVRVHSDIQAADSARTVGARAYTVGRDIVFGAREYDPSSSRGARLLAHELTHVVQQAGATSPMRRTGALGGLSSVPQRLQRLGANPGCTAAQGQTIHGAIFNARGWLNKAIPKLETSPLSSGTLGSLRRNFGLTFGVAANAALIAQRLKVAYHELSNNPFGCATAAKDPRCANGACGDSFAGRHASTICADVTLTPGSDPVYATGCVLHESFHAAFSNFTVDQYSGWHGHASGMPTYPGTGTDPLLNADSYTTLVMELS
ncbi:eCIS core domain-containing protein [Paraburkholderia aromaticivorans]|uniref:eCIS core domain-containing protein n=1 Tax=Paraburkholderia aromaticivorans TaxID=2026199 RepID=UPI001455F2B8|nr:DUF4157 domain-containing protein [Paraburkholderia aromaticivorans]